VATLFRPIFI